MVFIRKKIMKKIKLMIVIIGCLVTTSWGADSMLQLEGALGEAESSVSFFRNTIESTIAKAGDDLIRYKENFNNPSQSLPEQYINTKTLESLVNTVQELKELQRLLANCEATAKSIRMLLETARANKNND